MLGILRWHWQLHNQSGTEVLEVTATGMFDLSMSPASLNATAAGVVPASRCMHALQHRDGIRLVAPGLADVGRHIGQFLVV